MSLNKVLVGLTMGLAITTNMVFASEQTVKAQFQKMVPDVVIKEVSKSPINSFYQIQVDSGKVFYMSEDGKYLLQGYVFDLSGKEPKNLTLQAEEKFVAGLINSLDKSKMVIFQAKDNKPKTHITVFTDTTCPYCHRLHQEVPMLNANGVEVRYLAFPREGFASRGFDELQKVWCADNKQEAMNQLMQEVPVKSSKKCDSPVVEHYVLGQKIGVRGTPAVILENGQIIPGYQAAPQLINAALQAASQVNNK